MDLSVVIPAYNESRLIGSTIRSIVAHMPTQFRYEIIVVDHGSTDDTAALATQAGARVIDGSGAKTIAALRNLGVARTTGRILVFMDADITLSDSWSAHFGRVITALDRDPRQIFGSNPGVPADTRLLVRCWFMPKMTEVSPTHIGSCHLIISRTFFHELGGFPEDQETSEEFLLCYRARRQGGGIIGMPELVITHHGAPTTLREFMKAEFWHGRGDWNSLATVLSSRVAVGSLLFMLLHVGLIAAIALQKPSAAVIAAVAIVGMCVGSAVLKFAAHGLTYVLANSVTFYFYYIARGSSLFSALWSPDVRKRARND